jgi:hypothetical protein
MALSTGWGSLLASEAAIGSGAPPTVKINKAGMIELALVWT